MNIVAIFFKDGVFIPQDVPPTMYHLLAWASTIQQCNDEPLHVKILFPEDQHDAAAEDSGWVVKILPGAENIVNSDSKPLKNRYEYYHTGWRQLTGGQSISFIQAFKDVFRMRENFFKPV